MGDTGKRRNTKVTDFRPRYRGQLLRFCRICERHRFYDYWQDRCDGCEKERVKIAKARKKYQRFKAVF